MFEAKTFFQDLCSHSCHTHLSVWPIPPPSSPHILPGGKHFSAITCQSFKLTNLGKAAQLWKRKRSQWSNWRDTRKAVFCVCLVSFCKFKSDFYDVKLVGKRRRICSPCQSVTRREGLYLSGKRGFFRFEWRSKKPFWVCKGSLWM